MDSSRSGLLSTLIMTVPLIVVPAIALLRPPVPHPGLSTSDLEASADEDFFSGFDGIGAPSFDDPAMPHQKPADSDGAADFSEYADDPAPSSSLNAHTAAPGATSGPAIPPDPFSAELSRTLATGAPASVAGGPESRPGSARTDPEAVNESMVLEKLKTLGVSKTLWFSPGGASVGFVAFLAEESIAGTSTSIQYRFEAIGSSRTDALSQVLAQIERWRGAQGAPIR